MEEQEIMDRLSAVSHTEGVRLVVELLKARRHRYRDKLESMETEEIRGRSKECKDLIAFLS